MKKLYIFIFLFFFGIVNFELLAQTFILGTGQSFNNTTSYPAPYGNYYWGAKHQILIRASELTAIGAVSGDITSLAFNVVFAEGNQLDNFIIKMKPTNATEVNNNFDTSGFITAFGPQVYNEYLLPGWRVHTFTSPFGWDGSSNILIETCFNNSSSYPSNIRTYYSDAGFYNTAYYKDDNATVCAETYTNEWISTYRPDIKLEITPCLNP